MRPEFRNRPDGDPVRRWPRGNRMSCAANTVHVNFIRDYLAVWSRYWGSINTLILIHEIDQPVLTILVRQGNISSSNVQAILREQLTILSWFSLFMSNHMHVWRCVTLQTLMPCMICQALNINRSKFYIRIMAVHVQQTCELCSMLPWKSMYSSFIRTIESTGTLPLSLQWPWTAVELSSSTHA